MSDDLKKVSLAVSIHSGSFSILPSRADVILINVNVAKQKSISQPNHVIYLVDTSVNMPSEYIDCIRRHIRDGYKDYASYSMITYADDVRELSSKQINELKAGESGSNLEKGLRAAFELADTLTGGLCGIIVISATSPTNGFLQLTDFNDLVNEFKPSKCFIETIGIGLDNNAEILEVIGRYHYAPSCDVLSIHMHTIKRVITTAVATDSRITLFMPPTLSDLPQGFIPATIPDTCSLITKKSTKDEFDRNVIVLGTLCHSETYTSIVMPFGYTMQRELFKLISGRDIELNYTNMEGKTISLVAKLSISSATKITNLPLLYHVDYYIWAAKKRLRTALDNDKMMKSLDDKLATIRGFLYSPGMYPITIQDFGINNPSKYTIEETNMLNISLLRITSFLTATQKYLELLLEQMSTTGTFDRNTVLLVKEILNM